MKSGREIEEGLREFRGSEQFTRYMGGLLLTEGTRWLAESADCFWLCDVIASYQHQLATEDFQIWKLTVSRGQAVITMRRDKDEPLLVEQAIPYTAFPLPELTLWAVRNELGGVTVMLPSEY